MSDLLNIAIAAHGGLERWSQFKTLQAEMAIRGAIFEAKRIAGLQDDVTYEMQLHQERVTVDRFGGPVGLRYPVAVRPSLILDRRMAARQLARSSLTSIPR